MRSLNNHAFWIYLLVMAGVTYLIRMLPLVLVKKKITNTFLLSFLHYIPTAVLSVMTIPAVFYATGNIISAVVGFVVAFILALKNKGLLTVAVAAVAGVLITELLMRFI